MGIYLNAYNDGLIWGSKYWNNAIPPKVMQKTWSKLIPPKQGCCMLFGTRRNPKAPPFRRAKRIKKDLSGSIVHFMAPISCPPFSDSSWGLRPVSLIYIVRRS